MEIHPPHHAPLSFREVLLQLGIVTLGILIALSLEGGLTWWHHRALVRETRERIHAELRGDQRDIQDVLKRLEVTRARFTDAIDVADHLPSAAAAKDAEQLFGAGKDNLLGGTIFAWLNTSSFTTAEANGALALMAYDESIKYADAYDLQNVYIRMQEAAEKDAFAAALLADALAKKPTSTQLEDARRQLRVALGGIIIMNNIATKLNELYSRALKE